MKKILFLFSMFIVLFISAQAQQPQTKQVGDPSTYLTVEQLAKYNADIQTAELQKKLETYGNWVGVGGEIGNAIKEGLTAVVDVADKFGNTDVGKFTLVMVAWKVIGKDIVRIVLGFIFIALFTWLLIFSFKRTCLDRRILIENTNTGFLKYPKVKKYQIIEPLLREGNGLGAVRILHLALFMISIWITYGIMFAG